MSALATKPRGSAFPYVVAVLLLLVSLAAGVFAFQDQEKRQAIDSAGSSTQGVVIEPPEELAAEDSLFNGFYTVTSVQYSVGADTYYLAVEGTSFNPHEVGDEVTVHYTVANPLQAYIYDSWVQTKMFLVLGLGVGAFAGAVLIIVITSARRRAQ